jgi:uncharacterized RDD family membrane protein YckC
MDCSNFEYSELDYRRDSIGSMTIDANAPQKKTNEPLASAGARLGSYLLEAVLAVLTLGIGWLIWSFVVWGKGTTPGHQILKQYVVKEETGETFSWGRMAVRELLVKQLLCGILAAFTFGIFFLVDSLMVTRDDRKSIHDRISGSLVVQR